MLALQLNSKLLSDNALDSNWVEMRCTALAMHCIHILHYEANSLQFSDLALLWKHKTAHLFFVLFDLLNTAQLSYAWPRGEGDSTLFFILPFGVCSAIYSIMLQYTAVY